MHFDFDKVLHRENTGSLKWDKYKGRDVIPMWIADMDFQSPPAVLEALRTRVEHGIFGYAAPSDELIEVVVDRLKTKYDWQIETSWIVWLPGLVPALNVTCRAFCNDGDEVLTFVPIYPPFLSAPKLSRRTLKTIPLCREDNLFTFDIERLEQEISSRSKLLLLCNPHNPTGRVYTGDEITKVMEICLQYKVIICSDEVHCDLILDDKKHVPTATLNSEISANTITLMSPSKTFNVPGLNCALAIIPDKDLRARFLGTCKGIVPATNALGYVACLAAYRDSEEWRRALIRYLRTNRDTVYEYINEKIPKLSMDRVEATYLAWINAERLKAPDVTTFFEKAGVGISDGSHFQGKGYVRLNFGCPRTILLEALERMKSVVTNLIQNKIRR
jgi:cystathionine beta-lyase